MTTKQTLMLVLSTCLVGASLGVAQQYRCDWSVVGIAGGDMTGGAYKCGATAGQTAAGQVTGTSYWALIGFWQPEGQTGVREQAYSPSQGPLKTRLYAPKPNPFRGGVVIRYSLAAPSRTSVRVCDLAGRVVRTLANGRQKSGSYSMRWDGRDDRGRLQANGVYFCRFGADDYRVTEKLVLQR